MVLFAFAIAFDRCCNSVAIVLNTDDPASARLRSVR
jgi:hypothetical protein